MGHTDVFSGKKIGSGATFMRMDHQQCCVCSIQVYDDISIVMYTVRARAILAKID